MAEPVESCYKKLEKHPWTLLLYIRLDQAVRVHAMICLNRVFVNDASKFVPILCKYFR